MAIEALIFDVDGTLADTEEAHRTAFNLAFKRHGLGWVWERAPYRDLLRTPGGKERLRAYIERLDVTPAERQRLIGLVADLHASKTRLYNERIAAGEVPLRSGIERLLNEAVDAGCRLAIASTTSAENVDALLQATLGPRGLDLFDVIACGDQVRHKKPAPDIFELALSHLGIGCERAIAFEDSEPGLQAARAAGLWTVVTPTWWSEGSDLSGADLLLPELGDPAAPLHGEPGRRLLHAGWLGFDELMQRAVAPLVPRHAAARQLGLRP